jgi:PAS domain S-box-containing protein
VSPDDRPPRILVVDADADEALLVEGYLREGLGEPGLTVRRTLSAAEARIALAEDPPDVLLLDVRAHDGEALALLEEMRDAGSPIPAIVLTGRSNAEAALHAHRLGAAEVLVKPSLTPASLAATVRFAMQLEESRRKEAETERALRRAERQAEALVASSLDIVTILDREGRILFTSPSTEKLLGHRVETLVTRNVLEIVCPEDAEAVRAALQRCLESPGTTVSVEFGVRRADGAIRQLESLTTNLLDDPGVLGLVVYSRDVTERHRSEDALRRLEAAVEQSASVIFLTDAGGTITYVNPAFTRTYGYTREEAVGANPRILKSGRHDAPFYAEVWAELAAGHTVKTEVWNRARDGRLVIARASIAPIRDRRGALTGYLAVQDDVTERNVMNERLRLAQKMEALGHLAREVAHELDGVLAGVLAGIDAAAARLPEGSAAAPLLGEARAAAARGSALGHELLSFGRGTSMELTRVGANALQRDAAAQLRGRVGPGVSLRLDLSPETVEVTVDRKELAYALVQLAEFLLESLPPGGTLTLGTALGTLQEPGFEAPPPNAAASWVVLTVGDDGTPMDEETRSRLFDPFGSSRALGRGGGLGLAAPFGTVKQAGGFLFAAPAERGNLFRVYLPPAPGS